MTSKTPHSHFVLVYEIATVLNSSSAKVNYKTRLFLIATWRLHGPLIRSHVALRNNAVLGPRSATNPCPSIPPHYTHNLTILSSLQKVPGTGENSPKYVIHKRVT